MKDQARLLLPAIVLSGLIFLISIAAFVLLYSTPAQEPIEPLSNILATASPTQAASPTEALVTATPARPTWTLQPTETSTPTVTPTLTPTPTRVRLPTLTPALPFHINDRYQFNPISDEWMNQIALTVAEYPAARFNTPQDRLSAAYQADFIYPALIYQEALLRFPDSPLAPSWQWGLAVSLARLGDSQAIVLFQNFILEALNRPELSPEELPGWFQRHAPDLSLRVYDLLRSESQGDLKLLEIPEGHMLYLLQQDPTGAFHLFPLSATFNFLLDDPSIFTTLDLNGDGVQELALYLPEAPGNHILATPRLFSLATLPPQIIPVLPGLPIDFKTSAQVSLQSQREGNGDTLVVTAEVYPACPMTVTRFYRWDGNQVAPSPLLYTSQPQPDLLSYCEPFWELVESFWEPAARLEIAEKLSPLWPPPADPQGRPYPAEAKDKLRFQYAVNLALADRETEAVAALQELLQNPSQPDSSWTAAARAFVDKLQNGDGLYRACQEAPSCDMHVALQTLIRTLGQTDPALTLNKLPQFGVELRATGTFDFDQDGTLEPWFTLRQRPGETLEFWLIASSPAGPSAVFVGTVHVDRPAPYWSDATFYPGVFQIQPRQGYRLLRLQGSGTPFLEPVSIEPVLSTFTRDAIIQAEKSLFSGENPAQVRDKLLDLRASARFNCSTHRVCDRYRYLLGLAAELAGDEILARDTYIELWWENRTSPLTAAARLKLSLIPTPTATPRPTSTATWTPTLTSPITAIP